LSAGAASEPASTSASAIASTRVATLPASSQVASHRAWSTSLTRPGLPNLRKVSDTLYRGAQPSAEGYAELKKMGVATVVDLRDFHDEAKAVTTADLQYRAIPMGALHPEDEDVVAFLKIVMDKSLQPVFVHCQHGSDRTGMTVAVYRIFIDGWTKEQAIEEMTEGATGFHTGFQNLLGYIRRMDVESIRQQAGLAR
jgi:protein tyrosine/serine phosphatase